MKLRSLGYSTDLMLAGFDGEVTEREDYVVVRTPSSPRFWWGNFVLFRRPPGPDDCQSWQDIYQRELGHRSEIRHVTLAWDTTTGETGDLDAFRADDFEVTESVYLTANATRPATPRGHGVSVRPLHGDHEWQQALETQLASPLEGVAPEAYLRFMTDQFRRYRRLVEAGHGQWFGAFLEGHMAGGIGLFARDGIARGQSVSTRPELRRRGVCSALVHQACQHGFRQLGATDIVLLADPEGDAIRVYRAVGFEEMEHVVSVARSEARGPG